MNCQRVGDLQHQEDRVLHLNLRNFGPLQEASIQLRPLTILIGDNQAGKSFAAMTAHALLKAIADDPYGFQYGFSYRNRNRAVRRWLNSDEVADDRPNKKDPLQSLHTKVVDSEANEFIELSAATLDYLERYTQISLLKRSLMSSLEDVFAVKSGELIRNGSSEGSVELSSVDWRVQSTLSNRHIKTSFDLANAGPVHVGYVDRRRRNWKLPPEGKTISFRPSDRKRHSAFETFRSDMLDRLQVLGRPPRFPESRGSFYIPAIRSGLLLSHRLFLSLLVRNVHRIGFEPFSVPQMTGVTAEFLQSLLLGPGDSRRHAPGSEFLSYYEKLLTGGEVYFKSELKEEIPFLHFRTDSGLDLPLTLTSSTVTETAPLFLLLRVLLTGRRRQGMWLIIEEPESHLSPQNQAHIAEFLAALVSRDVNIILTTHSSYLLEKINNLIVKSSVEGTTGVALKAQQVSAHEARFSGKDGSRISSLPITEEDGIDLSAFVRAYEGLYEESFEMKRAIDGNRSHEP